MSAQTCPVTVSEPPGYWHDHECGRKAKFEIAPGVFVCGVHHNQFLRRNWLLVAGEFVRRTTA